MPGFSFNERFAKAAKIIEKSGSSVKPVEIEFGDGTNAEYKNAPIKNIYKPENNQADGKSANILEYDFEPGGAVLNCRVEEYSKGFALFADFLRDAKKYYRKTCLNAKFIYFFSYRPMYRELNHEQLCWYLFWRSRVRNGDYIKTGLSYIFIYIFEQINLSDLIGADKVYANLIKIWKNYRKEFPRIDKYMCEWLTDFTLINQMKINLDDISEILPEIINSAGIPEIYLKEDFFKNNTELILNSMPVYDYKKSKFYSDKEGKNKDLFDYHINKIMSAVLSSDAFGKILKNEIADGVKVKSTRESFMGAVCIYDYKKKITIEYKNLWKNFYLRELITNAVRYAENIIRDYLQIKSKLNVTGQNFPAELTDIIKDYKNKYLTAVKPAKINVKTKGRKPEAEPEELEIAEFAPNLQAAAEIERESWETTNALLELQSKSTSFTDDISDGFEAIDTGEPDEIYESLEEIAPDSIIGAGVTNLQEPQEDIFDILEKLEQPEISADLSDMAKLIANLSEAELSTVEMLISKSFAEAGAELIRERGVMIEAALESINEKAMDLTGDIIFEDGQIIDDYLEEISECLKK